MKLAPELMCCLESGAGAVYSASSIFPDGVYIPLPGPIAAVRMNSSALTNGFTMRVLQGEGW
jgi:hypothetical protein